MRKKRFLTLTIIIAALFVLISAVKFVATPLRYKLGGWGRVIWDIDARYNFCKYTAPPQYPFGRGHYWTNWPDDERELVFYKRQDTGQLLIFLKLPEHLSVNLAGVKVNPRSLKETFRLFAPVIGDEFTMPYYLPVLFSDPATPTPNGVWIHGLSQKAADRLTTPTTEILYLPGHFQQIALEKPHPWWRRYPVPVIAFPRPMQGALAVVRHKTEGWTLFVVGAISAGKSFDEAEFKQVLESVTFDAQPHGPDIKGLPPLPKGWRSSIKSE